MSNEKMRVLLYAVYSDMMNKFFEEIGICYIAAFMREKGYNVSLMADNESNVDYEKIKTYNPHIIGMPIYASSEEAVYRVSRRLKEELPDTLICVGGYSATAYGPDILAECKDIDFCIRGEGELTWYELVKSLEAGEELNAVQGLIYRKGNQIIINPERELIRDFDALPVPARDLLVNNKHKVALISSSRGCTGNCSFCLVRLCWKRWRGRSPRLVADELEHIVREYGVRMFHFTDCSFEDPGVSHDRVREIASEIIKRNIDIAYITFVKAEFHKNADDELMQLLKKSGLYSVIIGVETANQWDLKLYNKRATLEDNVKAIELFRKHDIHYEFGFIMFNPYSTFEGLKANIDFIEKYGSAHNMDYFIGRYIMFKGCPLNQRIESDGLLKNAAASNGCEYHFADGRIEKLADYLSKAVGYINSNSSFAFSRIRGFISTLTYWKTELSKMNSNKDLTGSLEQYTYQNLEELNKYLFGWFRSLIELAEEGWDENKAESMSELCSMTEHIKKFADSLEVKKSILFTRLTRYGHDITRTPFI